MLGRRGPLSKIVGGGIGLAKEYQADRKSRKDAEESHPKDADPDERELGDEDDADDSDDEKWAQDLDAAQLETTGSDQAPGGDFDEKNWIDNFLMKHPPPSAQKDQPLSMPVIIPERRPGFKTRGFVRAYAPVLEDAGIDQDTFIEFLEGFEKSMGKHKFFHVANIAVWVADKIRLAVQGVSLIARVVTFVVHVSIEAGRRGYMNYEQNQFFDRLNDEFFKPRGLFAMIIKYNPKSDEPDETVDATTKTVQAVANRDDEDRAKWKNLFQGSAGKVKHEEEVPDFAPLIFPQLDSMSDHAKENAVKHFGHFLAEYYDRRGQAKFDGKAEGSKLAGLTGEKEFASRFSDPNHPASQGGLIQTVTGGSVQYQGPLQKLTSRRNARRSRLGISRQAGPDARKQRKDNRPTRKMLKQDVLYLMVVNMPTKEEMDTVLAALEQAQKEKPSNDFNIRETLGLGGAGLNRK